MGLEEDGWFQNGREKWTICIKALGVYWIEMVVNDPALHVEHKDADFHKR